MQAEGGGVREDEGRVRGEGGEMLCAGGGEGMLYI